MNNTILRLLGVLIALVTVPCARGQQIPPVTEGERIVRTTFANNRLTMVDVENNFQLMYPQYVALDNTAPGVTAEVRMQEQPTGFDLIYTFTNTGLQPARLGRLVIGKFNMGNHVYYRDFRHVGEPKQVDYNDYAYQAFPYPHGLYSPVWTLYNDDYALSVSLQYPVMSYKHDARVMLGTSPASSPESEGPRGYFIEYRFANLGQENAMARLLWPGQLNGGESRTYVVSVRVTKNPNDWIRTLTPYRDYFRSMYGGVQYRRDARPIRPVLLAVDHLVSPTNPYGYDNYLNKRPDLYGWRPWTDNIKEGKDKWSRVMLWAPTGLYNENRQMNYPFQFTTRWESEARMQNVFDDDVGLPSIGREGMSLGLWWGRALQVAREWNTAQWEAFDPDNPAHVRAAMAEMDLAIRAGAKEIGLDTFNPGITPIWKLVPWLERLHEAYPDVKFCVEPITCDILHRLGATFIVGWTTERVTQESDLYDLNNPFYLADLLVPGHESWGAFSYHIHRANNYPVTPEIVQRDMERIASLGYVPVMLDDPPSPQNVRASESWLTSMPADVLRGSGWNTNYMTPRAHRQPDGRLVIISESNDGAAPPRPTEPGNRRVAGTVPQPPAEEEDAAEVDEPAAPASPAPVVRPRKKFNGSIRVQQEGEVRGDEQTRPIQPGEMDLPGGRSANGVAVPTSAGKKGGKTNATWLEIMAKKGIVDRANINRAVKKMRSVGPSPQNPHVVQVPTDND